MNNALVYISAILFLISVFPVHVLNYVYVSTMNDYASVNVTLYGIITIINANTDDKLKNALKKRKKKLKEKDEKEEDGKILTPANWLRIYNKICITKIVQLADFGLQNEANVYAALAQKTVTDAIYTFVKVNGGKTKLKNYAILNYEHGYVNYYFKLVGVINIMSLTKLITIFYWEKLKNEHKIKKVAKRRTV